MIPLFVSHLGRTQYAEAWQLQQKVWALRQAQGIQDTLLLTEHNHVYTLGKSADDNHLLASDDELKTSGIDVYHIDRGGDITYHGPGQLVGYPIIDLQLYGADVHQYLRNLEEVIIRALAAFGIPGEREEDMTGVWVRGEKIAAIGVKVSRWITMHGFALNVSTDLSKFERIIPCGIFHKGVTSVQRQAGCEISFDAVQETIAESFAAVFGCEIKRFERDELYVIVKNSPSQPPLERDVLRYDVTH